MKERQLNCWLILVLCSYQVTLSSCATTTNRTKTIIGMVAGAAVGAAVGAISTPAGTKPAMHAAYWGLAGASSMAVVGLFVFDEQKRSEELERKLEISQKELDALHGESTSSDPKLIYEKDGPFGKEVPQEYQRLVKPGQWSVYKLNQWIMQGDNSIIHQDKMIKLIPPTLSPKPSLE